MRWATSRDAFLPCMDLRLKKFKFLKDVTKMQLNAVQTCDIVKLRKNRQGKIFHTIPYSHAIEQADDRLQSPLRAMRRGLFNQLCKELLYFLRSACTKWSAFFVHIFRRVR